jgi:drug/metabolite transporter (DMT)-like permease
MTHNSLKVGHLTAFITILIWGTTFISTKILLNTFSPIEILFLRFLLGLVALYFAYPSRLHLKNKKEELYFIFAGLTGITLYFLLENIALTYTFASNVGIMISVAPFFTAILAHFFTKGERLTPQFFLGFVAAMAGISLISFNGSAVLKLNPLGDLLSIAAAMVWAIYSLLTKKISSFGYHTILTTRRIFLYGLLFMLPILPLFGFHIAASDFKNIPAICNLLFLGLGASALCFVTWNYAVKQLGVIKTSIYIYISPAITVVTSILILKERITIMAVAGTILTLTGLLLSQGNTTIFKAIHPSNFYKHQA